MKSITITLSFDTDGDAAKAVNAIETFHADAPKNVKWATPWHDLVESFAAARLEFGTAAIGEILTNLEGLANCDCQACLSASRELKDSILLHGQIDLAKYNRARQAIGLDPVDIWEIQPAGSPEVN